MSQGDDLTKIVVDLPNHWATGGESMWARPLGEDLFEVRNIPFYAYGLNFLDIVRAVEPSPDKKPVVLELVKSSRHKTLRVSFNDTIPESERPELLRRLNRTVPTSKVPTPSTLRSMSSPRATTPPSESNWMSGRRRASSRTRPAKPACQEASTTAQATKKRGRPLSNKPLKLSAAGSGHTGSRDLHGS